ncbi:MAG: ribulose-phosphate 3-epimerase [Myxococcota bacterium]
MSAWKIAPSILSADFGRLGEEVAAAEQAGADWLHLDVMDGHFVPNLTIGPDVVAAVAKRTTLPVDVHLMVREPDHLLDAFVAAGATALGVHVEACTHLHRTLSEIRRRDVRACVALNPATPAEAIRPVLSLVDQVLVMTVNPGFGGQAFIAETLPKIRQIRGWIDELRAPIDLVVDGGVGPETIERVALHGARVFVMGNAFFKSGDYKRFCDGIRGQLASLSGP